LKIKSPIVVVGIGEIGSVFARGFLRLGHPVYPVTRDMDMKDVASELPHPEAVLLAVGESDLHTQLAKLPESWKSSLILIQNELLPKDWQQYDLKPTVVSVWFEKKKGQDVKVVVPSPVFGEKAQLVAAALETLDIPISIITDEAQMTFELVRKNYYILASNIAGLKVGGTVSELWKLHRSLTQDVLRDIHAIQEYLTGQELDNEALTQAMLLAFEGDPDHACMGRSAPERLKRALEIAYQAGIDVPTLKRIAYELE